MVSGGPNGGPQYNPANVNGLGGSELYHYELVKELHLLGHDITLFSLYLSNI